MYNKEGRNFKLFNILLSVIALFVIIFIVIWAVNKGGNNSEQTLEQFNTNMNNLHETAKEFFAGNLPEDIGDSLKITLDEMYDMGLTDELTYGNTTCDPEESYISITKSSDREYRVKTNLVCGEKSDNLTEKITSNTVIENEDGDTILDEEKDGVDLEVNENDINDKYDGLTSSDGKTPDSTVDCLGPVCTFIQIPTQCTTVYTYEHVKRSVTCPDGYTIGDSSCIKSTSDTKAPTPNYTEEKTQIVDAKVNTGESHRVYVDPVVETEDGTFYCTTGTRQGNYCYTYENKETVTEEDCPSGYNQVGNYCYKYADKIPSSTSGCPSGYDQVGSYCYKYTDKVSTPTVTTKCADGSTPTNGRCLSKTIDAVKSYTAWGNPTSTYQTSTKESTYTYELSKKVLVGQNTIGKSTVYTYAIYKRSVYYTCSIGDKVGTKCYVYTDPVQSTTYTPKCPTGYTEDPAGRCYVKTGLTSTPTSTCPSGYTDSGSVCYIRKNLSTSSYTTCPAGYTEDAAGKCFVKTPAKYSGDNIYYSCPKGYTQTGTGKNTQCYKLEKTDDEYYCENANATLKGTLCYIKVPAQFTGNSCDYGYIYSESDGLCHKTSQLTTPLVWSDAEYIYTHNKYEAGYQRTGKGSFVQTCTPIEDTTIYK